MECLSSSSSTSVFFCCCCCCCRYAQNHSSPPLSLTLHHLKRLPSSFSPYFPFFSSPKSPTSLPASRSSPPNRPPLDRRHYRRSLSHSLPEPDVEEQLQQLELEPHRLLQKGDPNSMQAVVKTVMSVGCFVSLPTGRDGYLPADDLGGGFAGGLAVINRLFHVGQEITVRIVCRGGGGREIVSIKKAEFAPPTEQETIESLRIFFENEKKFRMNPRNRRPQRYQKR